MNDRAQRKVRLRAVLGPAALFGSVCLSGCAATADFLEHTLWRDNHLLAREDHPWHSGPGQLVGGVVGCIVFVPLLPVFLLETIVEGEPMESGHQVSKVLAGTVGGVAGSIIAMPFYVIGFPLEFVDWKANEAAAQKPDQ